MAIYCFQIWRNENCEVARLVISKSMEKRKKFVKVELMARQWILYCQMIRFKHKVSQASTKEHVPSMLYTVLYLCIVFCVMIWWITLLVHEKFTLETSLMHDMFGWMLRLYYYVFNVINFLNFYFHASHINLF